MVKQILMNFIMGVAYHRVSVAPWKEHWDRESTEDLRFDSSWGLRIFSLSHACDKMKNTFLYFFTGLKTYHFSYSMYKHDAINIADPSSMQDVCRI